MTERNSSRADGPHGGVEWREAAQLPVTLLYVPGDRPDRVRKALTSDADVVVVDLEDAVAPAGKASARQETVHALEQFPGRPAQVRVNPWGSPWHTEDVCMLDDLPDAVDVRLPKVGTPDDVHRLAGQLSAARSIHCLLESARGVEHAYQVATGHEGVASLALGEADLRSELGPYADVTLRACRVRVVLAARAAGLPAPLQSVWTDVRDTEGLHRSCQLGRAEGFIGRAAIHPAQLPVIRAAYRPEPQDVARARGVVQQVEAAQSAGEGMVVTDDGEFLDAAMLAGAHQLLQLAERTAP